MARLPFKDKRRDMDEQDNGAGFVNAPLPNGEDTSPAVGLISQYVKDLSFENPNAPGIFQSGQAPEVNVQFDIAANQVGDEVHEVSLKIEVRAESEGTVAFLTELTYAGLFGLRNVPADAVQGFLLGEAPRLLFPFARRVVADAIRDGGFPPLLLEPIDFNTLYHQQAAQRDADGNPVFGQA
jgi:preprotein translocase subunit SecB